MKELISKSVTFEFILKKRNKALRVKVKELIKSKSVTFEFIVSSDLNLSNKASSTEIISGGIWVTVCVNIMGGDDCGDDDDGVGGDRMSILLLILWHNYVYDDGDWGRGGPYFRRIFRTMDLSRRIPRKPKMGLEGEKNSMMPKKRKKEIQL